MVAIFARMLIRIIELEQGIRGSKRVEQVTNNTKTSIDYDLTEYRTSNQPFSK